MLIQNENGTFTSTGRGTTRAEQKTEADFAREREADRIATTSVKKLFGWNDEDLERAIEGYGFPRAVGTKMIGIVRPRRENVYSRAAIGVWSQQITDFCGRIVAARREGAQF